MKKILAIVLIASLFGACKKNPPGNGGNVDVSTLHERLPGKWDIVAITYDGTAKNPLDSTQTLPFIGIGEEVVGFYEFDTIPNPNIMDFHMNFKAPLNFDGGAVFTLTVNEGGYATYEVDPGEGTISGDSYVIQPSGDTTHVRSSWIVEENSLNKQVWSTEKTFFWDNDLSNPIYVTMVTTLTR